MADIIITAVDPGVDGNLIFIKLIQEVSATVVAASVVLTALNQVTITITVGFTANFAALRAGTWNDVATALNAIPTVASIVTTTGSTWTQQTDGVGQLTGGTQGLTPGVYYFAQGDVLPAMPPKIQVLEPIILPEYFCVTHRRCGRRVQGSKQVYVYRK